MAEDSNGRWTKDYHKKLGWGWFCEPLTAHFFEYCCLKANYKEKVWMGIKIERGAFASSINNMSIETGMSVQQIRTAIKNLTSTGEISTSATNKYTIISVCNYGIYQQADDNEQQTNNKQITNEQQTNNKQITTTLDSIERVDRVENKNNPQGAHACMREGEGASISEQGAVVLETYMEFTEANHMAAPEKFSRFKCDISTHTATIADTLSQILGRAIAKKDVLEFLAKAFSDKLYQNNWSLDFLAKRAVQIHNIKQPKEPEQPNNILPEGVEWVNESRKVFSYIAEDGTRKENRLGQNEFFHNGRRTYKPEKYDFPDNGNEKFRFPPLWAKPRPLTSDVTFWNGEDWYGRP